MKLLRGFVIDRHLSSHENACGFIHSQTAFSPRRRYFFHEAESGAAPEIGSYVEFCPDSPNRQGQSSKALHIRVLISKTEMDARRRDVLAAGERWNGAKEAEAILARAGNAD